MKTLKRQLALHKKARAQSRANYSALLAAYRLLARRNSQQARTIYRFQRLAQHILN